MSDRTAIEWTDATWNPVTGCDKVSPGCDNCYAESIAHRFAGSKAYPDGFDVTLHPERLDQPVRWRRPRRVFVNSMSDLFHDQIPDEYIARVFGVMAANRWHDRPTHTFQVLTKRHARMRRLLSKASFRTIVATEAARFTDSGHADHVHDAVHFHEWPLPNVWLGVSVEDQKWADIRIPALLDTPAAVRFLSCEPLLGHINLANRGPHSLVDDIDWVIVGGESGPGARPMHPDWARSLRDQCDAAGVPFLFKQWGEWAPAPWFGPDGATHAFPSPLGTFQELGHSPTSIERNHQTPPGAQGMRRVGKKTAGRELDGHTWDQYPTAVT